MTEAATDRGNGKQDPSLMSRLFTRLDGWVNVLTGLGDSTRDKLESTQHLGDLLLTDTQLENLYNSDDMAARIVDTVPEEMLRQGFSISVESSDDEEEIGSEEAAETEVAIKDALDALDTQAAFIDAMKWGRLFGGGAIFIAAQDGSSREQMAEPLDEKRIQTVESLTVLDKRYLTVQEYYDDPMEPNYGQPKTYLLTPITGQTDASNLIIHESRLIIFTGTGATIQKKAELAGWGLSVLQRVTRVLRDFNTAWQGVSHVLTDAAQGKFYIKGLIDQISAGNTETIQTRMALVDMNRSVARALALDADGEKFERDSYDFGNVDAVLQMFMLRLSAAARFPVTILMGQSPAGMDATGESDIRWFYDTIRTGQENQLKPKLERVAHLVIISKQGPTQGREPANWGINFPSLWQPTDKEKSEIRKAIADADKIYYDAGVLLPEEIALSRFTADGWSMETTMDAELRRLSLEEKSEKAKEELEAEDEEPEPQSPPPPPAPAEPQPPEQTPPPEGD